MRLSFRINNHFSTTPLPYSYSTTTTTTTTTTLHASHSGGAPGVAGIPPFSLPFSPPPSKHSVLFAGQLWPQLRKLLQASKLKTALAAVRSTVHLGDIVMLTVFCFFVDDVLKLLHRGWLKARKGASRGEQGEL